MNALIRTLAITMILASAIRAEQVTLSYNFITTTNHGGQDILLVGPENEDIRIGILGRIFFPTEESLKQRDIWPSGLWTAINSPPCDPCRFEWRYTLLMNTNGTVSFIEEAHYQDYDELLQPKGLQYLQATLMLNGTWLVDTFGKGTILFTEKKEAQHSPPGGRGEAPRP